MSVLLHGAIGKNDIAIDMIVNGNLAPVKAVLRVAGAVSQLKRWGLKPVAFFEGAARPHKLGESESRREEREEATRLARRIHREKLAGWEREINKAALKAVRVTPELRRAAIYEMARMKVPIRGSLHESDGQMAWAFHQGEVDVVFTGDSDMIALGCKVIRIEGSTWTKTGQLRMYDLPRFLAKARVPQGKGDFVKEPPQKPNLAWAMAAYGGDVSFAWAVLCGCDYNARPEKAEGGPEGNDLVWKLGEGSGSSKGFEQVSDKRTPISIPLFWPLFLARCSGPMFWPHSSPSSPRLALFLTHQLSHRSGRRQPSRSSSSSVGASRRSVPRPTGRQRRSLRCFSLTHTHFPHMSHPLLPPCHRDLSFVLLPLTHFPQMSHPISPTSHRHPLLGCACQGWQGGALAPQECCRGGHFCDARIQRSNGHQGSGCRINRRPLIDAARRARLSRDCARSGAVAGVRAQVGYRCGGPLEA